MPTLNKSTRFTPLNTLRFIPADKALPVGYSTFAFDQGFFWQQIRRFFQQPVTYYQKVESSDPITIYFDSIATTAKVMIITPDGNIVYDSGAFGYTHSPAGWVDNHYGDQYYVFIRQIVPADIGLAPGYYHFVVQAIYAGDGAPTVDTMFVTEAIALRDTLLAENSPAWPETIFIEYANADNEFNVFWAPSGTPKPWGLRVEAHLDIDPACHDVAFENMFYEVDSLQSIPFRVAELIIGGAGGVPPWMLDKVNRALACTTKTFDGVEWKKDTNSSWSIKKAENYPMKVGIIKLRDNPEVPEWEYNNAGPDTFRYHDDFHDESHD